MALRCRGTEQMGGLYTGLNTKHIALASRMVADYTGMVVQPHKAIVGANAFAHESGIHQDGMWKHKGTYEILSPEDIGLGRADETGIVLGKLSGRHALKQRLNQLGYEIDGTTCLGGSRLLLRRRRTFPTTILNLYFLTRFPA